MLWAHLIQASVHAQQNGVSQVLARDADEVNEVHLVATKPAVLILHLRAEGEAIDCAETELAALILHLHVWHSLDGLAFVPVFFFL